MGNQAIYCVVTKADGNETTRLIRATSKLVARAKALEIVTVRRATQDDMLMAVPPSNLPIEDAS
jgi:hypothetical protein